MKSLWKLTFFDSDSVINNFFEKSVVPENTVGVFDGEKAVSALYALECSGNAGAGEFDAYYIYGVSTLKEYRKLGLMKKALGFVEEMARNRGVDALFLVPANRTLFSMYEKFGYRTNIYFKETEVPYFTCQEHFSIEKVGKKQYENAQKNANFPRFSLKNDAFLSFFSPAENAINCFSVENKGYCLYEKEQGEVTVHELFGDKKILLGEIFKRENVNTLKLREYSENKEIPYGMTKFLNNSEYAENFFFGVSYGG